MDQPICSVRAGLRSDEADIRRAVLAELSDEDFDRLTLTDLLPLLRDPDNSVRQLALKALGELNDVAAIPAILEVTADSSPDVSSAARSALAEFRTRDAVDLLTAGVAHWSAEVRAAATAGLRELHSRRSIPALRSAIDDHSPLVRREAVLALGQLRDPSVLRLLIWAIHDPNADVRMAAVSAVGAFGDDQTLPELLPALHDHDWKVRRVAANALGEFPASKIAVFALRHALRDENTDVVREALISLGRGHGPVDEDLDKFLTHPLADLRLAAVKAIGEMGDNASRVKLASSLQDSDLSVARAALKAISRLESQESSRAA